jgi:hypothetical protein
MLMPMQILIGQISLRNSTFLFIFIPISHGPPFFTFSPNIFNLAEWKKKILSTLFFNNIYDTWKNSP